MLYPVNKIPLELYENPAAPPAIRPAWLRPVRKRMSSRPGGSDKGASPAGAGSAPVDSNDNLYRSLFDSPGQANLGAGMDMSGQSYSSQLLTNTGGLVEPLTQGSLAPLTADMFGGQDVSDLLAYLGGPAGDASAANGYNLAPSASTPITPLMFGGDVSLGTSSANGLGDVTMSGPGTTVPMSSVNGLSSVM